MAVVRDIAKGWSELLQPGANEVLVNIRSNEVPSSDQTRYEHFSVDRDAKPKDIVDELRGLSTTFPLDVQHIELMLNGQVRLHIWKPEDAEQKLLEYLRSAAFVGAQSVVV
ncbi:hypothetical protein A2886_01550 [candidate division WWE3 bacterium RIFCSPHIGHO2_01_FULL_42_13]|uniref:Uncharacterized protein n=1 Tax=candidate division WWE3 bacterium RIFCSPHIGHO2_01_FULL_42_13 TaxID=1802617 RepID=A0A1F4UUN7_UNCKA|nr:MAG: hypothetical protein A2886_01550 [candidate division WWE3 bacterium RIFCSPHIGHO2_01_FULL_42_13]